MGLHGCHSRADKLQLPCPGGPLGAQRCGLPQWQRGPPRSSGPATPVIRGHRGVCWMVGWLAEELDAKRFLWGPLCAEWGLLLTPNLLEYLSPPAFPRCLMTDLGFFGFKFQLLLGSPLTLQFLLPQAPGHHGKGMGLDALSWLMAVSLSPSLTSSCIFPPVSPLSLSAVAVMKWLITLPQTSVQF